MAIITYDIKITDGLPNGLDNTVDLTADETGYSLIAGGFAPRVAKLRRGMLGSVSPYEEVDEDISCFITGTTRKEVLERLSKLQVLLDQARKWSMGEKINPIYIEIRMGAYVLRSLITGVDDGAELVSVDPAFYERLKAYQVGPVTIRFRRRGEWFSRNIEMVQSDPYPTDQPLTAANLVFSSPGDAPIDIEVDGLYSFNNNFSDTGAAYVGVEQGFLLVTRFGGIQAVEAENVVGDSTNFTAITGVPLSTTAFSNRGHLRMNYSASPPYWQRATCKIVTINPAIQTVERLGVFAMFHSQTDDYEYRVRAYGVSNGTRVYTPWQPLDFKDTPTPDEDPLTLNYEQNHARPVFIGTLSSLGGFTTVAIEVEVTTVLGSQPATANALSIDSAVLFDQSSMYSRAVWVDGRGFRRYPATAAASIPFKLVFNTGATTLGEPKTYIERPLGVAASDLGTLMGEKGDLPPSSLTNTEILAYKYPLGDTYIQAPQGVAILWFGRGVQFPQQPGKGHCCPVKGMVDNPSAVSIVYRAYRRLTFLTPR